MDKPSVENAELTWRSLCKVGGVAALIAAVLFASDFLALSAGGTAPASALDWLTLLQDNRGAGLLQLFFSDLFGVGFAALLVFALYIVLRRTNAAYATLAMILAFVGVGIIFATNPNYALIVLSDQYAAATSATQQAQLLAAAESTLALGMQGTGLLMGGLLLEGALVMICAIMLQDRAFSRWIVYLGLAGHGLDVARSLVSLIVIPFFGTEPALAIGVPLLVIGGTLQLIWYVLIGRKLLQMGSAAPQQA